MKIKYMFMCLFFAVLIGCFFQISPADAAKNIARVSAFDGEVIVISDSTISRVQNIGHVLNQGDRVQTKGGAAEVTFDDGAILKIRPYTSLMIQERQEKRGWFVFKTKKAVRRITVFVGKLWFKSGKSKRKNYLQSPTAVCGVRGSALDFGSDGVDQTYMNIYEGAADVVGNVLRGFFDDPGVSKATKSSVYQSLAAAAEKTAAARTPSERAEAQVSAFKVIAQASIALQSNPDPGIAKEAQLAANVAAANIAAAEARMVVAQLVAAGAPQDQIAAARNAAAEAENQLMEIRRIANEIYDEEGGIDFDKIDNAIEKTTEILGAGAAQDSGSQTPTTPVYQK